MEETVVPKRPREDAQMEKDLDFEEYSKRHKPYTHILSLLESEEEESIQDLSPLMTTLQNEITCASNNPDALLICPAKENDQYNLTTSAAKLEDCSTFTCNFSSPHHHALKEDEEESVIRHLLQASDDELGIPNTGDGLVDCGEDGFKIGDGFSSLCDELWEFEDDVANYHALLQSELFLWGQ